MASKIFLAVVALFLAWVAELYYFHLGFWSLLFTLFIGLCAIYWVASQNNNPLVSADLQNTNTSPQKGSLGDLFFGFVSGGFWGGLIGLVILKLRYASMSSGQYAALDGLGVGLSYVFYAFVGIFLGSTIGFIFGAKLRNQRACTQSPARIVFGIFVGLAVVLIAGYFILLQLAHN